MNRHYTANDKTIRLQVRVTPKSSKNEVSVDGDVVRVNVSAAPEDGKANKAVVKLLSKHYGVPQSAVRIIRGESGRDKLIQITRDGAR